MVEPKVIQFAISVQHDCRRGDCKPAVVGKELQEREETSRDVCLIKHVDDDHFLINTSGLHPFVRLRWVLGPELTDLKLLYPDREKFHKEAASKARGTRESNRQKASIRHRQNTAAKKKAAEEAAQAAAEAARQAADSERRVQEAEEAEARGEPLDDEDQPEKEAEPEPEPEPGVCPDSDDESEYDGDSYIPRGRETGRPARKRKRGGQ
jgi:hypothetical protein